MGAADDATVNSLEFLLQGAGVPNAGLVQRDRQQNFYHFWRWTWIQYVWLALANGAAVFLATVVLLVTGAEVDAIQAGSHTRLWAGSGEIAAVRPLTSSSHSADQACPRRSRTR